jgi:hypothetical protein
MQTDIEAARPEDFLHVAALDRIAWPVLPDTFIPDGEHIWRVWCEHANVLVARITSADAPSPRREGRGEGNAEEPRPSPLPLSQRERGCARMSTEQLRDSGDIAGALVLFTTMVF